MKFDPAHADKEKYIGSMQKQTSTSVHFRLPPVPLSVMQARRYVRAYLGFAPGFAAQVEIALSEAITNAVAHAGTDDEGEIEVTLSLGRDAVDVVVRDQGFASHAHPDSDTHDFGMLLMRTLSGRFEIQSSPDRGTTVKMQFPLSRAA
jgi:anti-sigma regulatory factor (Ser/Thr protein kinase)